MIQWYPGHMTKAKREMAQKLSLADVVIEILDARAPLATSNPDIGSLFKDKPHVVVLNKEDLADPSASAQWISFFSRNGVAAVPFCAVRGGRQGQIKNAVDKVTAPLRNRWAEKGAVRSVRAMVAGIPNVGKSSVINALSHQKRAKVGAAPGVTRGQQWVRISDTMELLDTPGILWPKLSDQKAARHLAYINAIRDEVLEIVPLSYNLLDELKDLYPGVLYARFAVNESVSAQDILTEIAQKRGCVLRGGELNVERAAGIILEEFRAGKLGRITLERPKDGTIDATEGI